MEVMLIQSKRENIFDNEDFARMLRDRLGDDAERYFREQTDPDTVLDDLKDRDIWEKGYCTGECEKVEEAIEYWRGLLIEAKEKLEELEKKVLNQTRADTEEQITNLIWEIERKV